MAKLYGEAPIDELGLARRAKRILLDREVQGLSQDDLQQLSDAQGPDIATAVFYQAIVQEPVNQRFIDVVDRQKVHDSYPPANIQLFVVPAFFYQEYPEVGGGGQHVVDVARACGMDADIIPVLSTGSVSDNCRIIYQTLKACTKENIWIMSMSKGSAETRMLFQDYAGEHILDRIKLWFNVSGLAHGCHLVDHMLSTPTRRLKTRALCLATGASYHGLEQLLTANPRWQRPVNLPEHTEVINIFGVPILSHVQRALISRYHRLKHLGPNDGMVLLSKAYLPQGPIYPLWGADHFLRDSRVIPLLYRLFGLQLEQHENKSRQADVAPASV